MKHDEAIESQLIEPRQALIAALPRPRPPQPALAEAYASLAGDALDKLIESQNAANEALAGKLPPHLRAAMTAAPAAAQQYRYRCDVAIAGLFYQYIEVNFFDPKSGDQIGKFKGQAGGLTFFNGLSAGTSFLNYPYEVIRGWEARFQATFGSFPPIGNVNWWGMKGEVVGSFVGGNPLPIGQGIMGGKGRFE